MSASPPATLVLADGTVFRGRHFGAEATRAGEVVFNTAMTGYQEIATDPSYAGQIVCMTYPHIGNTGVNDEDLEAAQPWIKAFIVREHSPIASNFRSTNRLDAWLRTHGIVGIEGVDTRRLTRHVRNSGAIGGVVGGPRSNIADLLEQAKAVPSMAGMDLVTTVTCKAPYAFADAWPEPWFPAPENVGQGRDGVGPAKGSSSSPKSVVVMDFGVKRNILRSLRTFGMEPYVVPASTSAADILARRPDGVFLSNGPGDPAAVSYAIETIKELLGKVPTFGICLGHQLMALAAGATTSKLKFGHRGANHPIREHATGRIEITSQNHGFVVDEESLADTPFKPTHTNLNDNTNAGMASEELRAFSVQYHPEASPGPHDAGHLFYRFRQLIEGCATAV